MSSRLYLFLLMACMVIIPSCEYEPKEVFERTTIDPSSEPTVQSVNLDLAADTIYTGYSDIFMYDFSSNNKINTVRFTYDGTEQFTGNLSCGAFYLKGESTGYGIHTLVAEVAVSSGTQSMADIVGAEGYVMTKTWILKVDKKYPSQTHAEAQDGYLHISWPTYTGPDFVDYSVYRLIGTSNVLITRQTSVGYVDQTYVGEGGTYYVRVNRKDQQEQPWGEIRMQSEIPKAKLIVRDGNQFFFAWNKSKYYKAVGSYRVHEDYYLSSTNIVKTTQDPEDTTYHISSSRFGESVYFKLQLIPRENNLNYSPSTHHWYFSSNDWGYVGNPLKSSNGGNLYTIKQVSPDEFIYLQDDDTIIRYSTTERKKVEKLSTRMCPGSYNVKITVSPQKKYLGAYYYCDHTLKIIHPTNFKESVSYNISAVKPFTTEPAISDNHIAVTNYGSNSYVYDLNQQKLLATYTSSHSGYTSNCYAISSNGEYLFLADNAFRLLKLQAPNFTQIWVNPGPTYNPPKYIEFHALNPEQLAYWDGRTFSIKKCSDFSTVYEFPLTETSLLNIDYFNNKMLCYKEGHLIIRSLSDGALLTDIPVNIRADNSIEACYLINNAIVCKVGVVYFLN